ncbi:hypothetical protein LCGC14_2102440 [marine sediment metagenome]|uniref:Uncharacterized protein n=1 Tax=marine sediment metagenome TaxID=412755 RepID=A0A0F9E9E4_9ZZZZ
MAFPQVEATNTSSQDSNVLNHTVSLPAGIQAGETLLVFFANNADSGGVGWPGGWNEIFETVEPGNQVTLAVAWRKATGGEGGTITVTTGNGRQSAHASYRISGAIDPAVTAPEVSTGATGVGTNPNPDSLTAGGGSDEYLWIAVEGNDTNLTVSAYPTNYDSNQLSLVSGAGAGNCGIGVASDEVETNTQDPGTFTISGSEQWVACTVAVYPAVVGWAGGDVLGVAIAGIAKINGVALADIIKVNGVA